MSNDWRSLLGSEKALEIVAKRPHILGNIIGKTKLQPIHSEWIRYVWDTNERRALMAYRGSYKTTSICNVGAIRWMLFHPNDRIAIIRKHVGKAAEVVNTIAQAMEYGEVQEIFKYRYGEYAKAKIMRNGALQYTFKKTATPEPSILALGIDGDITGQHFDKIIADDFVTLRDRYSRAERRNTKNALMEIQTNIIDPGKGIGYIGTPWHGDDAWKYVNSLCPVAKYPVDEFGYIIGDEEVKKKKAMTTPSLFAANYKLKIIADESLLFAHPVWPRKWDFSIGNAMAQLDTAFDGEHYCALTIAAPTRRENGQQLYQGVGFVYPGNIEDWYQQIELYCRKFRVSKLYVETNADKGASVRPLRARGFCTIKPYSENMNKHVKIGMYLYPVWPRIEWSDETDEDYMAQVTEYKEGVEPDDAPDSAAALFREAFQKTGSTVTIAESQGF